MSVFVCILYLGPLEHCFWVQGLGFPRVILVGLDPTNILTSSKAPFSQTLKKMHHRRTYFRLSKHSVQVICMNDTNKAHSYWGFLYPSPVSHLIAKKKRRRKQSRPDGRSISSIDFNCADRPQVPELSDQNDA